MNVIVAASNLGAMAAKRATTSVPIVFVGVTDPIDGGLVESLAKPGGTMTGLSLAFEEGLAGKWIELLKEAVPRAFRIAILFHRASPTRARPLREMELAAATLRVRLHEIGVRDASEFDGALATMARDGSLCGRALSRSATGRGSCSSLQPVDCRQCMASANSPGRGA